MVSVSVQAAAVQPHGRQVHPVAAQPQVRHVAVHHVAMMVELIQLIGRKQAAELHLPHHHLELQEGTSGLQVATLRLQG
jgi:hypothetical protein